MTKEKMGMSNQEKKPKFNQLPEELYKKFTEYYNQYKKQAFKIAFSYTKNIDDAQDLTQKAFLKAYQNFAKYKEEKKFLTWLVAIMKNTYYSDIKKKQETGEMYEDVIAPDKTSRSTEQIVLDKEAETAINKIIDKLPKEFKEVINLSHVDHLRDQDIAEKMKIPEGTVKSRLSRGRAIVQGKLKKKDII